MLFLEHSHILLSNSKAKRKHELSDRQKMKFDRRKKILDRAQKFQKMKNPIQF